MQQIYRRTSRPRCDFNLVALKSQFNMAVNLWNMEQLWRAASASGCINKINKINK